MGKPLDEYSLEFQQEFQELVFDVFMRKPWQIWNYFLQKFMQKRQLRNFGRLLELLPMGVFEETLEGIPEEIVSP